MTYRDSIIKATGCDPADAPVVEELMRVVMPDWASGCLDHLDRHAFGHEARQAQCVMASLAVQDPEMLAWYRRTS